MSPIELHAMSIRRSVAALRSYAHKAIDDGKYETARQAVRACDMLEYAIVRTLPGLGLLPPLTEAEVDAAMADAHSPSAEQLDAEYERMKRDAVLDQR